MLAAAATPSTTASPTRRLSARRGSVSAADPFAKYAEVNLNPNRSTSSTLTIVRVLPPPQLTPPLQEPPSSRRFRRSASNNPEPPSPRLSFALNSFTTNGNNNQHNSAAGGGQQPASSSPSSSPRLRPSSPTHHRSHSTGGVYSKPRLSADQLYDLAKQSTNPRLFPVAPTPPGEAATARPHLTRSPPTTGSMTTTTPATFTPLPDDIYLPFIDRPAEVAALISTPPSAKLFALLQQTFPKNRQAQSPLPRDPTLWTYSQLHDWLTGTPRETVPDPLWVMKARKCILSHSELIWERIKGALGVPPELEIDADIDIYEDYFNRMQQQEAAASDDDDEATKSDDLEDAGRKARGHWDDWDAIIDSPVSDRHPPFGSDFDVAIEPLVASGTSLNPPPLSLPASLAATNDSGGGLGDIAEGAEEDDEESQSAAPTAKVTPEEEKDVDPLQIHGIKISTSPISTPSRSFSPSHGSSPVALHASLPRTTESVDSISRSGSFSSLDDRNVFRRRPSFAGSVRSMSDIRNYGYESDGADGYDPVGDRAPGNPLFPSNFARLALGPTLAANNPSLRSPAPPPPPRYLFQRSNSMTSIYRMRSNSNNHEASRGSRFSRSDYAITVASEDSVHEDQKV